MDPTLILLPMALEAGRRLIGIETQSERKANLRDERKIELQESSLYMQSESLELQAEALSLQRATLRLHEREFAWRQEEARQVRKATEEAIRERFLSALSEDGGTAAQLRLAQSDTATSEETIARWQGEVARAQRQLELLAGRYPDGKTGEGVRLPELKSFPPTGLPSELLQRRPDLLEAERRFAAATKDSEEADLARFPSFALTASSGRTSSELSDLLRSDFGVWSLGANLTAPILSGGRLQANFAQAQSRERSALAVLQRTVLDAFGEVEQAIVADEYLARRIKALERALQDAEESDRASGKDYADGVDSILTVLQVREQRIQIASQLLSLRRQRLDNRVDLHLALGGDFQIREK